MVRLARIASIITILAIAFVTLGPIGERPHLGSASFERAGAFFVLGLSVGLAARRRVWLAVAAVCLAAGALELLQFVTPDRHGRLEDGLVKLAGGLAGVLAARLLRRLTGPRFKA